MKSELVLWLEAKVKAAETIKAEAVKLNTPTGIAYWTGEINAYEAVLNQVSWIENDKRPQTIVIVNGRPVRVRTLDLGYEEILNLAFDPPQDALYSMTYARAAGPKPEGTMSPGDRVPIQEKTIFNAAITSGA